MEDRPAIFALLPTFADGNSSAHLTLCSCGLPGQAPPYIQLASYGKVMAQRFQRFKARVWAHALFDENASTRVARVNSVELFGMRMMFEWLANSNWGFDPHISEQPRYPLPPVGAEIEFDRLALWFGSIRCAWMLGSGVQVASS